MDNNITQYLSDRMDDYVQQQQPKAVSVTPISDDLIKGKDEVVPSGDLQSPEAQLPKNVGNLVYSDQTLKTNITDTKSADIDAFVKSISTPKSFDYKNEDHGSHTEGGTMAQSLEQSKIGRSVVVNTPQGKMIDTAKLTPILASIMSSKIKSLENQIEQALTNKFKVK